jgi:hypothetical protein
VFRWLIPVLAGNFKSRAQLIAENACLRQQLVVLKHRQTRPSLRNADRRFWILASRWFGRWREDIAHRPAANGLTLASEGLEGLLELALTTSAGRAATCPPRA